MTSVAAKSPPPPTTKAAPPGAANRAAVPTIGKFAVPKQPPRIIVNAVEGWGKSSIASHAPNAVMLMAAGETGYLTLLQAGRVPEIPGAEIASWDALLGVVDQMIEGGKDEPTVIFDALGGFERLCHEMVCARDFKNDWGERGFASYNRGYDVAVNDWVGLLARLDRLRMKRGASIVFLSHCKIKTFKNPLGADFDRYVSDVHDKTWAATAKWADAVFFGNFHTVIDREQKGKGKGIGGTERVLYAERRDAFDAKNRYGMEPEMFLGSDAAANWTVISNAIHGANHA